MSEPRRIIIAVALATACLSSRAASVSVQGNEAQSVTLTGKVVDAACYMIHPPAASIPSHKDCGAACLARGVPMAIANETDGALYFPADGNSRLASRLDQRVRATGTVVKKSEPMELKMAVGPTNQMAVRVDGGYNVVTISSLEKIPAKPRK